MNVVGAVSFADSNWNTQANDQIANLDADDCTEFVSSALHIGGGLGYVGTPAPANQGGYYDNPGEWWTTFNGTNTYGWTYTFTVADDFGYQFLLHQYDDYPPNEYGSWGYGYQDSGTDPGSYPTVEGQWYGSYPPGTVVFYSWHSQVHGGGGTGPIPTDPYYVLEHDSLVVDDGGFAETGTPGNGMYIDAHTNNRYHDVWSELDNNAMADTTTITFVAYDG